MKTFNSQIKQLVEEIEDPMGASDIEGWPEGEFYNPEINPPLERDPDVENQQIPGISHAKYHALIAKTWRTGHPLLIYGRPGVGKSFKVKEFSQQLAERGMPQADNPDEGRIFVNFTTANEREQAEILKNPGKYFVLIDVRAASFEASDFVGLPVYSEDDDFDDPPSDVITDAEGNSTVQDTERLRTIKYKWAYLATQPDAAGFLFLDEVNQADAEVLSAMFMIVLDKIIFDEPISENIRVIAAGNLIDHDPTSENAPIPKALSRRFQQGGVASLIANPTEWLQWAAKNGIHPAIMSFVMSSKQKNFYRRAEGENDRFPDPDSLTALSKYLYSIDKKAQNFRQTIQEYDRVARAVTGSGWAIDFIEYIKGRSYDDTFGKGDMQKLAPHEKWSTTFLVQQALINILKRDPKLTKDDTLSEIQFLSSWIKTAPEQIRDAFKLMLDNVDNEEVQESIELMRVKSKEIKEAEKIKGNKTIQSMMQSVAGYASEYQQYSNDTEDTNLLTVNHETLMQTLEHGWDSKDPVLVYGDPGIGKSWAIKKFAEKKAKELGLPFAPLHSWSSKGDRLRVARNPGKYFIFLDVRVASLTPTDFMGLPKVFNTKSPYLMTQKFFWVWAVTQPNAIGLLFFDEINQTDKQVLKAMYSIINPSDKFIFDRHISEDIMVVAAGNLQSQEMSADRLPLPQALNRRFKAGTIVLDLDPKEWIAWAKRQEGQNRIHPAVLHFIEAQENPGQFIFQRTTGEDEPDLTPDTLRTFSQNLYDADQQFKNRKAQGMDDEQNSAQLVADYELSAQTQIPMEWGEQFLDYLFKYKKLKWTDIIQKSPYFKDPKTLRQASKTDKTILDTMLVAGPYLRDKIEKMYKLDPKFNDSLIQQRATEVINVLSNYGEGAFATFISYVKRTGNFESFKTFMKGIMGKNSTFPPEVKQKASDVWKKVVIFTQKAKIGDDV